MNKPTLRKTLVAMAASLLLSLPAVSQASNQAANIADRDPSALRMTGDLVVARPMMLAATLIGTAVFVVSLPFSLIGGNVEQAADTLMVEPAKNTFFRCLGCTDRLTDEQIRAGVSPSR